MKRANDNGSYTLPEAARRVANLKTMLHPPCYLLACSSEDDDPATLMSRLKSMPPDVKGQAVQTLEELLRVFRTYHPTGRWLLFIKGVTPGYENPRGFLDTPILEKAIEWHHSQGHGGEI